MSDFEAEFSSPISPPIEHAGVDTSGWWWSVLGGIALVIFGIWLLSNLYESVVVLGWLVGISLIIGGIAEVVALGGQEELGWPAWIAGGLVVAAGIAVLVWPDITVWALAVVAGIGLISAGLLRVLAALANPDRSVMPLQLGLGGLGIVVGVLVLVWPEATVVVIGVVLGIKAIVTGLVAIGVGWQLHRMAR